MFLPWNAGTENAFLAYAKALESSGSKVINLVHSKAQIIPKIKQNNLQFIKTRFLGRLGKHDLITILYFKYLLKKHKINVVFAHQGRLISLFKKSCPKNIKLIGVNHGHNPKHSVGTDLAITLNSKVFEETIKLGQNRKKTFLLPNAIDLGAISFTKKDYQKKFTIGSYGRFSHEKGYDILIESVKILNDQNIDFNCIIGGSGVDENNLKNTVKKYGLQKKVSFIGWVENQEEFFKKIDLFVLPSRREESPLTPLESMKYSTPVLATKNFGCLDLIKNKENGFLTELENPLKMAEKLELIINNKSILPEISGEAFRILEENYSYTIFKERIARVLKNLN
ncbi:MAG: glycosyltransferase involved in cell wall biosynthesis [Rickettsiales bacterium]|jgi:glycosyltransferase involved in cell wall biosynthesis